MKKELLARFNSLVKKISLSKSDIKRVLDYASVNTDAAFSHLLDMIELTGKAFKRCTLCGDRKMIIHFGMNLQKRIPLAACRPCHNENSRRWYANKVEKTVARKAMHRLEEIDEKDVKHWG